MKSVHCRAVMFYSIGPRSLDSSGPGLALKKKLVWMLGTNPTSFWFKSFFMQLGFSVSNWQKVQLNTGLLKWRTQVFTHSANIELRLNEIKAIKVLIKSKIKLWGSFNLQMVGETRFFFVLDVPANKLDRSSMADFLGWSHILIRLPILSRAP